MPVRLHTFARLYTLFAAVFLTLFGLLGTFAPKSPIPYQFLLLTRDSGYLFGVFPVNLVDSALYIFVGLLGFLYFAWPEFSSPRLYARGIALWYGILAVGGFFPIINSVYGLMPFWGWDIALHFSLCISAMFAGYWPFWVPNEAYDEGDADESGRPGVAKRRGFPMDRPDRDAPRPDRPAARPPAGSPGYRAPKFDAEGNPRP